MADPFKSSVDLTKEIRFAVVMYGGVSLAIYINGVAQELYRLVRSTAIKKDANGDSKALAGTTIDGTERVYRKLSHLVSDDDLLKRYRTYVQKIENRRLQLARDERNAATRKKMLAEWIKHEGPDPLEVETNDNDTAVRTAFIVDILSGTSAGGINAIYLAKALANDQKIDQLKDLWVNEGDIALLLNDKHSVMGLHLSNQVPPQSLLNSRRMYYKLLKSLNDMEKYRPSVDNFQSPNVDELDLFITTTDIAGVPVPLRLLDGVVYERRHRNVFHFKYGKAEVLGDDQNDFRRALNPFLAFAARCTSSFPFAFEPMRLCDIDEVVNLFGEYRYDSLCKSDSSEWQRFFQEELDPQTGTPVRPPRFASRSFGDGGYLDNKPFSYATETLAHRQSDVPVDRKLIYIEPSPEHPEDEPANLEKPNALQNVKAAVLDLPTYETIREDLQRVLDRNQLIERVNRIISGIEKDVNNYIPNTLEEHRDEEVAPQMQPRRTGSGAPSPGDVTDWYNADLVDMVNLYSRYFLPYRRLRISSVTDEIAKLVARLANFDEDSDQFLAIRALVRAWREDTYADYKKDLNPVRQLTVNGFLSDYDLSYRLRRLNATRTKVDQLTLRDPKLLEEIKKYSESLARIKAAHQDNRAHPTSWEAVNKKFPQIRLQDYGARLLPFAQNPSDEFRRLLRFVKCELNEIFKQMRTKGRLLRSHQSQATPQSEKLKSAAAEETRKANPLLPHIARIGITPSDLNEILGMVADHEVSDRKAGPAVVKQEQDEDDYVERARALLDRPAKDHVRQHLAATAKELKRQLDEVFSAARAHCNPLFDPEGVYTAKEPAEPYAPISARGREILRLNPNLISSQMAIALRGFLGYYYHNFDDYDQIRFPIFYEADVGEADVVEVIRISPEDATSLIDERQELKDSPDPGKARQKLAGVSLHHFGAFLDRTWRQNDIMWGRLDGAERLIEGILPGAPNELMRQELIREAHLAILKEELKPQSLLRLEGVLSEALLRASDGLPMDEAIDKSLEPFKTAPVKTGIEEIVRLKLADDELVNFVGESYQFNRQLDPKTMLNSVSRATQIVGKMFEQMADANGLEGKRLAWIARLGQVFWGLVEVAVPNSILNLLLFHWLKILYFFEALVIGGSILLNSKEVQNFGLKALGLTLAVHVAVMLLRDYMRLRRKWQHFFLVVFAAVLVVLITVGSYHLYDLGVNGIVGEISQFARNIWTRIFSS
jgi:patatin-related protein